MSCCPLLHKAKLTLSPASRERKWNNIQNRRSRQQKMLSLFLGKTHGCDNVVVKCHCCTCISQFVQSQELSREPMVCGENALYKLPAFLYTHRQAKDTLSTLKLVLAKIFSGKKLLQIPHWRLILVYSSCYSNCFNTRPLMAFFLNSRMTSSQVLICSLLWALMI